MQLWDSLPFTAAVAVTSLVVVSLGLLYTFVGLAQLTAAVDALSPIGPEQPRNGVQQLISLVSHTLLGGEAPMYLNQSAFAAAAVLCALVILFIFVEEALMRVKEKVREWGRLPSPQVLHHYNQNSYDVALAKVGSGLVVKKTM